MRSQGSMLVVFGRPGAGKTTIAQAAVRLLAKDDGDGQEADDGPRAAPSRHLYLDLDVCVPQWMRDNFAKGIYPTLQERADFIAKACEYVQGEIDTASSENDDQRQLVTIISFSFVNTDLRTAFRAVFPHAQWILVDTHQHLAEERISAREGHFYKNASSSSSLGSNEGNDNDAIEAKENDAGDDNSEWEFRPVDFPHIILDGRDAVDVNANRILKCIQS